MYQAGCLENIIGFAEGTSLGKTQTWNFILGNPSLLLVSLERVPCRAGYQPPNAQKAGQHWGQCWQKSRGVYF